MSDANKRTLHNPQKGQWSKGPHGHPPSAPTSNPHTASNVDLQHEPSSHIVPTTQQLPPFGGAANYPHHLTDDLTSFHPSSAQAFLNISDNRPSLPSNSWEDSHINNNNNDLFPHRGSNPPNMPDSSREHTWESSQMVAIPREHTSNSLPTTQQSFSTATTTHPQDHPANSSGEPSSRSGPGTSERAHGSSGNESSSGSGCRGGVVGEGHTRPSPTRPAAYQPPQQNQRTESPQRSDIPHDNYSTLQIQQHSNFVSHKNGGKSSPPISPLPSPRKDIRAANARAPDEPPTMHSAPIGVARRSSGERERSPNSRSEPHHPPTLFLAAGSYPTTSTGIAAVTGQNPNLTGDPNQRLQQQQVMMHSMGLPVPTMKVMVGVRPPPPNYSDIPSASAAAPRSPNNSSLSSPPVEKGSGLLIRVGTHTLLPPAATPPFANNPSAMDPTALDLSHMTPNGSQRRMSIERPPTTPQTGMVFNGTNSSNSTISNPNSNLTRSGAGRSHPSINLVANTHIPNYGGMGHPNQLAAVSHPLYQPTQHPALRTVATAPQSRLSQNLQPAGFNADGNSMNGRQPNVFPYTSTASQSFASQLSEANVGSPTSANAYPQVPQPPPPSLSTGGSMRPPMASPRLLSPHDSLHYNSAGGGGGGMSSGYVSSCAGAMPPPPLGFDEEMPPAVDVGQPLDRSRGSFGHNTVLPPAPIEADIEKSIPKKTFLPGHLRQAAAWDNQTNPSAAASATSAQGPPAATYVDYRYAPQPVSAEPDWEAPVAPPAVVPSSESVNAIVFRHSNVGQSRLSRPQPRHYPARVSDNPEDVRYRKDLTKPSSSSSLDNENEEDDLSNPEKDEDVAKEEEEVEEEAEEDEDYDNGPDGGGTTATTTTAAVSSESGHNGGGNGDGGGGNPLNGESSMGPHVNVSASSAHFSTLASSHVPQDATYTSASESGVFLERHPMFERPVFHQYGAVVSFLPPRPSLASSHRGSLPLGHLNESGQIPRQPSVPLSSDSLAGAQHRFSIGSSSMLAMSNQGNSLVFGSMEQSTISPHRRLVGILDTDNTNQLVFGTGTYGGAVPYSVAMPPQLYSVAQFPRSDGTGVNTHASSSHVGLSPSFARFNADNHENSSQHQGYLNPHLNEAPQSMDSQSPHHGGVYSFSFTSGADQRQYILHTGQASLSNPHALSNFAGSINGTSVPASAATTSQIRLSSAPEQPPQVSHSFPNNTYTMPPGSYNSNRQEAGGSLSTSHPSRSVHDTTAHSSSGNMVVGSLTFGTNVLPLTPVEFVSQSRSPTQAPTYGNNSTSAPDLGLHLMRSSFRIRAPYQGSLSVTQQPTELFFEPPLPHLGVDSSSPHAFPAASPNLRRRPFRRNTSEKVVGDGVPAQATTTSDASLHGRFGEMPGIDEGYYNSRSEETSSSPSQERKEESQTYSQPRPPSELTAGGSAPSPSVALEGTQNSLSGHRKNSGESDEHMHPIEMHEPSAEPTNLRPHSQQLPFYTHVTRVSEIPSALAQNSLSSGAQHGSSRADTLSLYETPNQQSAQPASAYHTTTPPGPTLGLGFAASTGHPMYPRSTTSSLSNPNVVGLRAASEETEFPFTFFGGMSKAPRSQYQTPPNSSAVPTQGQAPTTPPGKDPIFGHLGTHELNGLQSTPSATTVGSHVASSSIRVNYASNTSSEGPTCTLASK